MFTQHIALFIFVMFERLKTTAIELLTTFLDENHFCSKFVIVIRFISNSGGNCFFEVVVSFIEPSPWQRLH